MRLVSTSNGYAFGSLRANALDIHRAEYGRGPGREAGGLRAAYFESYCANASDALVLAVSDEHGLTSPSTHRAAGQDICRAGTYDERAWSTSTLWAFLDARHAGVLDVHHGGALDVHHGGEPHAARLEVRRAEWLASRGEGF